jgi:hypothetical protein
MSPPTVPLYGPSVGSSADRGSDHPTVETVLRLLAEPARLRLFAALVLGARSNAELVEATGLAARELTIGLGKLVKGGLVEHTDAGPVPVRTVFADLVRAGVPEQPPVDDGPTAEVARVLRVFVVGHRLVGLPAQRGRRLIVLEQLAQDFEPGVDYPERQVNDVLRTWTEGSKIDHVTVRRYLVDEQLLRRENGVYRRCGGWVDVTG